MKHAAVGNFTEMVRLLLDKGANTEAADDEVILLLSDAE